MNATKQTPSDKSAKLNLAEYCIKRWAESDNDKNRTAFTFVDGENKDTRWTYAEVWEETLQIAYSLVGLSLEPGDRILLRLPHNPDHAFAFFGAVAAGFAPIPLSPQLTLNEVEVIAADSGAKCILTDSVNPLDESANFENIKSISIQEMKTKSEKVPLPATYSEDPAFFVYTSGTTSRPKGVVHAHRSVLGRELVREGWLDFQTSDITLHAGTINWTYTLGVGLMDAWRWGSHAVLAGGESSPEKWLPLIERLEITIFAAVPTVFRQILKYSKPESHDLKKLRHVLCAGEPLPSIVREEWAARCKTPMYESLGMTEISTYISNGPRVPVVPGSPGRPQIGRKVAILEPDSQSINPVPYGTIGMLAVHRSDPGLMIGYWQRPDEEKTVYRGDWFIGGDLASMDEYSNIWFNGRSDDIIKSFGFRLSPPEIESTIAKHPSVNEVAIVGLAIDTQKTIVVACVTPATADGLDFETLKEFCEVNLAQYKQPHEWVAYEELPRTRNGKLQRNELVKELIRARNL
ncbi:MAG: acyl-CoA synthetase [Dehalococcoidia bacterium]|nr:acyl-CoA synthetase [Dehalococcoidia bacterium]